MFYRGRYRAETLPIRRKTLFNPSINRNVSFLSVGKGAYEVCDRLNNQDIGLVVSPVLACCLILTRRCVPIKITL